MKKYIFFKLILLFIILLSFICFATEQTEEKEDLYLQLCKGVIGCMTNKSLPPFYHLLCLFQRKFSLPIVNKKRVS